MTSYSIRFTNTKTGKRYEARAYGNGPLEALKEYTMDRNWDLSCTLLTSERSAGGIVETSDVKYLVWILRIPS